MPIFGTRPEAIKMAPVVKALHNEKKIETVLTVTAQHREMLDQVLNLFKIKPDYDLDIMEDNQTLSEITSRVLKKLEAVFIKEKPDLILVHGDTSTTFVASLAAYYQQIQIGHVEAGLRTGDKYSPFPEEINRHLTGVLADLHFSPTKTAKKNLLKENIAANKITVTGNTVIDALMDTVKKNYQFENQLLNQLDFKNKKIILLTAHRRENLGRPLEEIFKAVRDLVTEDKNIEIIYPVHLNPKVKQTASKILKNTDRIHLIEPLDYEPFVNLMNKSYMIMTDSGGIQEEAPSLGKPVLVLRDKTERPEAISAGTVKKVGSNYRTIYKTAKELISNESLYNEMAGKNNPYGDGKAADRIVNFIKEKLIQK